MAFKKKKETATNKKGAGVIFGSVLRFLYNVFVKYTGLWIVTICAIVGLVIWISSGSNPFKFDSEGHVLFLVIFFITALASLVITFKKLIINPTKNVVKGFKNPTWKKEDKTSSSEQGNSQNIPRENQYSTNQHYQQNYQNNQGQPYPNPNPSPNYINQGTYNPNNQYSSGQMYQNGPYSPNAPYSSDQMYQQSPIPSYPQKEAERKDPKRLSRKEIKAAIKAKKQLDKEKKGLPKDIPYEPITQEIPLAPPTPPVYQSPPPYSPYSNSPWADNSYSSPKEEPKIYLSVLEPNTLIHEYSDRFEVFRLVNGKAVKDRVEFKNPKF